MTFPTFLRALNSRNYRLFFAGQGVSLVGNWMNTTASAWLAYELSHSAFVVGLVPFANQIPLLLLAPAGGVLGDRWDRRRLLVGLQTACAVLSAGLTAVTLTGHLTVGLLVSIAALRGLINAVEFPTRQSFMVELVGRKDDLANAIALNSSLFNVARLIGPSVAGVLIVTTGAGFCYALDALSFLPVIGTLLALRLPERPQRAGSSAALEDLRAGWRYAKNSRELWAPLLMVPALALTGFAAPILAPVFARDVFHQDARTLGLMLSAMGIGALGSAIFLGTRTTAAGLSRWIVRGAGLVGLAEAGFAASAWLPLSLVCLVVNGVGTVLVLAGCNTLIQAHVEDDKRGRIMGLFAMGQGMFPVGSLLIGSLAALANARLAVAICAGLTLLAAFGYGRKPVA
ncbi:MAG: MFS transporter [Opitutae bacterium]|nr:MFS transporter [Opitutae bacterium]